MVERFRFEYDDGYDCDCCMATDENGQWVKWEDVASLVAPPTPTTNSAMVPCSSHGRSGQKCWQGFNTYCVEAPCQLSRTAP